jgi:hypothetical protein
MSSRCGLTFAFFVVAACKGSGGGGSALPNGDETGAVSATRSTIALDRTEGVIADGIDPVAVVVTVLDASGLPVPHAVVQLSVRGDGATLSGGGSGATVSGTSAEDGTFQATLRAVRIGTKALSASVTTYPLGTVTPLAASPGVAFVPGPPTPATISVSFVAPPLLFADGVDAATITVRVTDLGGNPLPGHIVQFAASGDHNAYTHPAAPTDAEGMTSGSMTSLMYAHRHVPRSIPEARAERAGRRGG